LKNPFFKGVANIKFLFIPANSKIKKNKNIGLSLQTS